MRTHLEHLCLNSTNMFISRIHLKIFAGSLTETMLRRGPLAVVHRFPPHHGHHLSAVGEEGLHHQEGLSDPQQVAAPEGFAKELQYHFRRRDYGAGSRQVYPSFNTVGGGVKTKSTIF